MINGLRVETVPCVSGDVGVPVVGVDLDELLQGAGLHGDLSHQLLGLEVLAGVSHNCGSQHLGEVGHWHLGFLALRHLEEEGN